MKIVFNDGSEMEVDAVKNKNGELEISTLTVMPDELKSKLSDAFACKSMKMIDAEVTETYVDFTILKKIEMYPNGRLVGYMSQEETAAMKEAALLVVQMQAQSLPDEQALLVPAIYPEWENGQSYAAGYKVNRAGTLYKCLQAHTSQTTWAPDTAASLWAKVLVQDANTASEWQQPGSTNPYAKGNKVTHNGKTWQSTEDNNVWEPGAYGWEEIK